MTDVIAQAQSGTGKTATFSISLLQRIDINVRETQALVLSPTRELATQAQSGRLAYSDASLGFIDPLSFALQSSSLSEIT